MARGITRWNPAQELLRERVNRLFENAFGDALAGEEREEVSRPSWVPAVDIAETDAALVLFAELPGLSRDEVEITLEDNVLTVRGERRFADEETRESYHRIERAYGAFHRSFHLPANVRADKVKATFTDGILKIEVPKAEESRPRKIEIS
jgi:HSP20 family protein